MARTMRHTRKRLQGLPISHPASRATHTATLWAGTSPEPVLISDIFPASRSPAVLLLDMIQTGMKEGRWICQEQGRDKKDARITPRGTDKRWLIVRVYRVTQKRATLIQWSLLELENQVLLALHPLSVVPQAPSAPSWASVSRKCVSLCHPPLSV